MFLLVHIREEDNQPLKDFDPAIKRRLKHKMLHGIKAMGRTYRLFGTSSSQLKEMSFWFAAIENRSIEQAWQDLGDFSEIKNVANYVARIGLYFSTSRETEISFKYVEKPLSNTKYYAMMIDDVETEDKKYCFTDGIGKISWGVAGEIARKLNIPLGSRDDIPSVFQVRIAGCKGMLAIDPESSFKDYYIKFRGSMEKFKSNNWDLEICEYSQALPLKFNNQVIMLLSDLGNPAAVFESYQNASMTNWHEQNENERQRNLQYSMAKDDLLKNKIPLPLNEARNMYGAVDETRTLEYGQVFIQYENFDSTQGDRFIVVTGDVLVAKMPCLYPGDFRKLTAVNVPQLKSCMRDCIVFPMKGSRPHPNEMSGSDLDGDQYWVYWGKLLTIKKMDDPLSYEPSQKKSVPTITNEIIIDHIIETFGAGSQGIICDVHLSIADCHPEHTRSADCKYLAELFARAVDAPKTGEIIELDKVYELRSKHCRGYPEFMKKYDQPIRESNSVLNKLFLRAKHEFFAQREHLGRSLSQPLTRSVFTIPKSRVQRKPRSSAQDKEFQQWCDSLGIPMSDDNTSTSLPNTTSVSSNTTKKPRQTLNASEKAVNPELSETLSTEQTISPSDKRSKKSKSIKQDEESQHSQSSSARVTTTPVDSKSHEPVSVLSEKRKKPGEKAVYSDNSSDPPTLINSAASCVTSKASASASFIAENQLSQEIVFYGMTTVTNRIKCNQVNNTFTVDLDGKSSDKNNTVDKLLQLMLGHGKSSPLAADTHLTLVISWGKICFKLQHASNVTLPKNIRELSELINNECGAECLLNSNDVKTVTSGQEPLSKSAPEYVLACKCYNTSSSDISLIFDDKKKLKKIAFVSTWWRCAVRGNEDIMDSFYEIRRTSPSPSQGEIDSKHISFSQHLQSIFKDPNSTGLLSGTSPKIIIDKALLKSTVQVVSLRRLIRYEYAGLDRPQFNQNPFNTPTNLDCAFYQVVNISTEMINDKIQTSETIEFYASPIQIAKKYEPELKQLCVLAENYFDQPSEKKRA
ncbi:unnamed protein product [Didymodactylos carnosus]|uniref:RNA-dependent RNA polymerase n=1 Tax=Didymodactylos carnosus TaxID=1234261 RepID=A0A814X4A5_9BILA|nr:unnamed protein product [Didymodactylos carnosus]CAF1209981.1 unnamed protein product [Didymodactylos carnosus]CAF3942096.1 unnamed protein product [Didymodactylos carnosus]CAF3974152.1 unnamed protein product [Didymodactylos carnosus]